MNIESYTSEELSSLNVILESTSRCSIQWDQIGECFKFYTTRVTGHLEELGNYSQTVVDGLLVVAAQEGSEKSLSKNSKTTYSIILILEIPLEDLPLLINHSDPKVSRVARFRLKINK